MLPVEIDISETAFVNAKNYYENKKKNIIKEKKTLEASKIALKQAEKTAQKEILNVSLLFNQKGQTSPINPKS
jgi:hypothetical protein